MLNLGSETTAQPHVRPRSTGKPTYHSPITGCHNPSIHHSTPLAPHSIMGTSSTGAAAAKSHKLHRNHECMRVYTSTHSHVCMCTPTSMHACIHMYRAYEHTHFLQHIWCTEWTTMQPIHSRIKCHPVYVPGVQTPKITARWTRIHLCTKQPWIFLSTHLSLRHLVMHTVTNGY